MQVQINNITFSFKKQGSDHMPDGDNLGFSYVYIQQNMLKRFKKECGWDFTHSGITIPHYDSQETREALRDSNHQCFNADTQIVLMKWLFEKNRKYKLDYTGLDPYWMFHDSCHAEGDVMGYEVNDITSHVEHYRLIEGAEFAAKRGIHMMGETLHKLSKFWNGRFRMREGERMQKFSSFDFERYLKPDQLRLFEQLEQY